VIWISWERHQRSLGISTELSIPLFEICSSKSGLHRYISSALKTAKIIHKIRPKILIVQNPSLVLSLLALLLKNIYRYKFATDSHNSGIFPLEGKNVILNTLSRLIQKYSDLTIVSNKGLKEIVDGIARRAIILPDKIPRAIARTKPTFALENSHFNIACICTFKEDEPYEEIISAAQRLPENIQLYITGRFNGKIRASSVPKNVHFTGFLPNDDYFALLLTADVVMDLTFRENCLVRGAYEGIAAHKPLILSNKEALKSYFTKGCIYVNNTAIEIAEGILAAKRNIFELKYEIAQLGKKLSEDWKRQVHDLSIFLEEHSQ
jgi:glycosyltransferase involved in cell wall biosynthesis